MLGNSNTPVFMVYYRNWRDAEMYMVNTDIADPNPTRITDLPEGIDIVTVFGGLPEDAGDNDKEEVTKFYTKLKHVYAPEMRKKGVKLLSALFYNDLYKAISAFDTDDEYDEYAKSLVEKYVEKYNLDGLDLDQEFYGTGVDENIVTRLTKLVQALGKYLGPMSGTGRYLVYDTNIVSSDVLNETVKPYFNFVGYQQYGRDSSATQGFTTANTDIMAKTLAGLTFPEEKDNNHWVDTGLPYEQSNTKKVADYVRENNLGGMFFYAVDRDGRTYDTDNGDYTHIKPTAFLWTKTAIAEIKGISLNDAKSRAKKYLDDNKNYLALTDDEVESLTISIAEANSLYEVYNVFINDDYYESVSPDFDLMKISLS